MLTGEYAILHGALGIAFPINKGQKMLVKNARGSDLIWEALDENGEVWFDAQISLYDFSAVKTSDPEIATRLQHILKSAVRLNSEFLSTWSGFKVETQLEFPVYWGAGSSSTLISMIADWAYINPFHLHFAVSNGSGYDIATAKAERPITYQIREDEIHYSEFDFKGNFTKNLYFVHLGLKQNTEVEIKQNGHKLENKVETLERISEISKILTSNKSYSKFNDLISEHEELIASAIDKKPVKQERFRNFNGVIKSLGAWGGDFILASSNEGEDYVNKYFKKNGISTIIKFDDMVL